MNVVDLCLSLKSYRRLQRSGRFDDQSRRAIARAMTETGYRRVLVFGANTTGRALQNLLFKRFAGFVDSRTVEDTDFTEVDAIVLGTAPIHYDTVCRRLDECFPESTMPVIRPFGENNPPEIGLILETQPRSGTHYTMDNLQRCLGWGFASVFDDPTESTSHRSSDGRFSYRPGNGPSPLVVKTHFFEPLHYPEYRYVQTVFLTAFPFDAYHSWGRMLAGGNSRYVLRGDSPEWQVLKGYISLNRRWLVYIQDKDGMRYEDYYADFHGTKRRWAEWLGVSDLHAFQPPRPNPNRSYWTGDFKATMDRSVFDTLKSAFQAALVHFWPERRHLKY